MAFTPINGIGGMGSINGIDRLSYIEEKLAQKNTAEETTDVGAPTFLDVFSNILSDAVTTNAQKDADVLRVTLGDVDDIEQIQSNIAKAEIATELLVTVKNTVVESYNEIIKMSI